MSLSIKHLFAFTALACGASAAPYHTNLLTNPGAETGDTSGWDLIGDIAAVGVIPRSGTYSFATSYDWNSLSQTIDLLDAGFSTTQLDAAPDLDFSVWLASRYDHMAQYALNVRLLDGADNPIAEWTQGDQFSPISLDAGTPSSKRPTPSPPTAPASAKSPSPSAAATASPPGPATTAPTSTTPPSPSSPSPTTSPPSSAPAPSPSSSAAAAKTLPPARQPLAAPGVAPQRPGGCNHARARRPRAPLAPPREPWRD